MGDTTKTPTEADRSAPTCYTKRDLEELGKYYFRHLNAMTREGLHCKSDIAAELATRDMLIDHLITQHNAKIARRRTAGEELGVSSGSSDE